MALRVMVPTPALAATEAGLALIKDDEIRRRVKTKLAGRLALLSQVWTDHFAQLLGNCSQYLFTRQSPTVAARIACTTARDSVSAAVLPIVFTRFVASRVSVPVAITKIVSPSPTPWDGLIALARPSSAICATLVAWAFVSLALVATTAIVVFWSRLDGGTTSVANSPINGNSLSSSRNPA